MFDVSEFKTEEPLSFIFDLRGTVFSEDTPVFKFKYDKGDLVSYEAISTDPLLYPIQWGNHWKSPGEERLTEFFLDRVPPVERSDYVTLCQKVGIKVGDNDAYLKIMKARSIKDELYLVSED